MVLRMGILCVGLVLTATIGIASWHCAGGAGLVLTACIG